jgi:hypothetical protein
VTLKSRSRLLFVGLFVVVVVVAVVVIIFWLRLFDRMLLPRLFLGGPTI